MLVGHVGRDSGHRGMLFPEKNFLAALIELVVDFAPHIGSRRKSALAGGSAHF